MESNQEQTYDEQADARRGHSGEAQGVHGAHQGHSGEAHGVHGTYEGQPVADPNTSETDAQRGSRCASHAPGAGTAVERTQGEPLRDGSFSPSTADRPSLRVK